MTLAERFQEAKGGPIQVGPNTIWAYYRMPVAGPQDFVVTFLSARPVPVQGLRLAGVKAGLVVKETGERFTDIVLWQDTAPSTVNIQCVPLRSRKPMAAALEIWNVWREGQITQAWLDDAGMIIEEQGDGKWVCRCSSSRLGGPKFDDLVLQIERRTPAEA